jgi:hypothetical protein
MLRRWLSGAHHRVQPDRHACLLLWRLDPHVALLDPVDQLMGIECAEIGGHFE